VTYGCDALEDELYEVRNIREFKDCKPAMLVALDLVIDDRNEADQHVRSDDASKRHQLLLTDTGP
jgi:hypothetical protein